MKMKRWLKRTATGAVLFVTLVGAAVAFLAGTGPGERLVAGWLERGGAVATGYELRLTDFTFTLGGNIAAGKIEMADAAGVWLVVDEADVAVAVGASLAGPLTFDRIAARSIRLLRRPAPVAEPVDEGPFPAPSIPSVIVADLSIPTIEIDPSVTGEAIRLQASGSARSTPDGMIGSFEITGDPGFAFTATATPVGDGRRSFVVIYREKGKGPLATALGVETKKELAVDLTGDGSDDRVTGRFVVVVDGAVEAASADYRYERGVGHALTVTGDVALASMVPVPIRAVVGERNKFALSVEAARRYETIRLTEGSFTSTVGSVRGEGTIDFDARTVDASVDMVSDDIGAYGPGAGGEMRLTAAARGALDGPHIDMTATFKALRYAGWRAGAGAVKIDTVVTGGDLSFVVAGRVDNVVGPGRSPFRLSGLSLHGLGNRSSGGDWTLNRIRLVSAIGAVTVDGTVDEAGGANLNAMIDVADAARFVPSVTGAVKTVVTARGNLLTPDLTGRVTGEVERFSGGGPMVGPAPTVRGEYRLADGSLVFTGVTAQLRGAVVGAVGSWRFADGQIAARIGITPVADPPPDLPLTGEFEGSVTLRGSLAAYTADVALNGGPVTFHDRLYKRVSLTAAVAGAKGRVGGDVDGVLVRRGVEGKLSGRFERSDAGIRVSNLSLSAEGGAVTAAYQAVVGEKEKLHVALSAESLDGIGALVGYSLGGKADGSFLVFGDTIEGKGSVTGGRYADIALGKGEVAFAGKLVDGELDAATADLALTQMTWEGFIVAAATASLEKEGGSERPWSLAAAAAGFARAPFEFRLAGEYRNGREGRRIVVTRLDGTLADIPLAVTETSALTLNRDGGWRMEGKGVVGEGAVSITGGSESGSALRLSASGHGVPLELFSRLDMTGATGAARFSVDIDGTMSDPRIVFSMGVDHLLPANRIETTIPPLSLTLDGAYQGGYGKANLQVTGEKSHATLTAAFPLVVSLSPWRMAWGSGAASTLGVDLDLPLDPLFALLSHPPFSMGGRVKGKVSVIGAADRPKVDGRLTLSDGWLDLYPLGARLTAIDAELTAAGSALSLSRFTCGDGVGGTFAATGETVLSTARRFPFTMTLSADRAKLISLDAIDATGSGAVSFTGDTSSMDIVGEVTLDPVNVRLSPRIVAAPPTLDVVEINRPFGPAQKRTVIRATPFETRYDIGLTIPGPALLEGPGVDTRWQGAIRLGGTAEAPRFTGTLSVDRGRVDLYGRPLTIRKGSVHFNGASPPDPTLDFSATATATDVIIDATLTGVVSDPDLSVSSTPPMPESEVMSALLFGRSMSGVSPLQALQVANALQTLSGGGDVFGFIGKTRKLLSLNELRLIENRDSPGEYGIGLGTYIGDGAYVEAEQSLAGKGAKVTVEVELSPAVTIDTQIGESAQSGVGINWKNDY
jgi:translocation and assembly module TamB